MPLLRLRRLPVLRLGLLARPIQALRRWRYQRALKALAAQDRQDWVMLLDRLRRRLPLPLEALQKKSSDVFHQEAGATPGDLLVLDEQYSTLSSYPAWVDFQMRLLQMKTDLEQLIIRGGQLADGDDATPYARVSYGLVLDMIALPQKIRSRADSIREELGLKPRLIDQAESLMQ